MGTEHATVGPCPAVRAHRLSLVPVSLGHGHTQLHCLGRFQPATVDVMKPDKLRCLKWWLSGP